MNLVYHIYLYTFILLQITSQAQYPHPTFKHYEVEDGLSSSKVYQVKQDSKGYMWFATNNGVSRFNGYEFENFSMNEGLPDNTVFEIVEDKAGRIWFLTLSNKLAYYEDNKIHPYKYNGIIEKITSGKIKTSFVIDDHGTVFLGISFLGILEIKDDGQFKIQSLYKVSKHAVVIKEPVPNHLIYSFNEFKRFVKPTIQLPGDNNNRVITCKEPLDVGPITRIVRLRDKTIACSFENKLYLIDTLNHFEVKEFPQRINWIYEDKDNDLWIGTYLKGVYYIHNCDFEHKVNYFDTYSITGVLQDREGGYWFASEGNSVYYTPSKNILTYDQLSGLKDNRINCLAKTNQYVYLGVQNGFIHAIKPSGEIFTYNCSQRVFKNEILNFYYDSCKKELWFSGKDYRGLLKDNHIRKFMDVGFYNLLPISENLFWAGNPLGIFKYKDYKHFIFRNMNREMKRANVIRYKYKDKKIILAGTPNGLWEFNTETCAYTYLGNNNPMLKNRVLDMTYDLDSTLIMATKGAGLLFYNSKGIVQLNTAKGLASDNVYKILLEDSVIWAATDKGLNRIIKYRNELNPRSIKSYTTFDGIASNEINDILKFDHKLWVATDKGLSVFNVDLFNEDIYQFPIYINAVSINDSSTHVKDNYQLNYDENNIKIKFIALGYKSTKKLKYRYRMEGLDTNWVYTNNLEVQYTTLPSGNYKFIVAVLNANGAWSEKPAMVTFKIIIPFWKTWWFLSLAGFILLHVIYYSIKYWLKKVQEQQDKSTELNRILLNLKLKALRAQMNPHFTFNVMNSIQHFILYKNDEAAHRYLSKFSKLIRAILNNSERNTVPLAEEVKALELYLDLEAMRFERHFDYEIAIDEVIDINKVEIPSMLIQPYVENAVKHGILPSLNPGKIKIDIVKYQTFIKVSIIDNGIGRVKSSENNKTREYRSFGTSITKERLSVINELYNSTLSEVIIDLEDDHGNATGTKVDIYIPSNFNK